MLPKIRSWKTDGTPFAVARVISTWGSAPRKTGASLLVSANMEIAGSVSGGCIEGSVIEEAKRVLESGSHSFLEYGVDDEKAWSVGLSCGGQIKVLVETWSSIEDAFQPGELLKSLESDERFVLVSTHGATDSSHTLVHSDTKFSGAQSSELKSVFSRSVSSLVESDSETTFYHVFPERKQLIIVGGADITIKLLSLASMFDFETTVIDPRSVFIEPDRFETAPDHVYPQWPQDVMHELDLTANTYAVLLTHDPKIDDPALHALLKSPAVYIGALGGKRTQEKRRKRMKEAGFTSDQISRIRGPVGLDIEASNPREIALSIMAEIIAVQNGIRSDSA